jgi:hypothetical protein
MLIQIFIPMPSRSMILLLGLRFLFCLASLASLSQIEVVRHTNIKSTHLLQIMESFQDFDKMLADNKKPVEDINPPGPSRERRDLFMAKPNPEDIGEHGFEQTNVYLPGDEEGELKLSEPPPRPTAEEEARRHRDTIAKLRGEPVSEEEYNRMLGQLKDPTLAWSGRMGEVQAKRGSRVGENVTLEAGVPKGEPGPGSQDQISQDKPRQGLYGLDHELRQLDHDMLHNLGVLRSEAADSMSAGTRASSVISVSRRQRDNDEQPHDDDLRPDRVTQLQQEVNLMKLTMRNMEHERQKIRRAIEGLDVKLVALLKEYTAVRQTVGLPESLLREKLLGISLLDAHDVLKFTSQADGEHERDGEAVVGNTGHLGPAEICLLLLSTTLFIIGGYEGLLLSWRMSNGYMIYKHGGFDYIWVCPNWWMASVFLLSASYLMSTLAGIVRSWFLR